MAFSTVYSLQVYAPGTRGGLRVFKEIAPQKLPAFFQGLDKRSARLPPTCRFEDIFASKYNSFIHKCFRHIRDERG